MARYAYERLSAQDTSFLLAERDHAPMHIGALAILESGPLRNGEGGIDIARYRRAIESVLHWIPRYRQKLAWIPIDRWPVWVDDRHFDLGYHIRHLSLPRPGTHDQLRELASRILARRLDPSRPLWEVWVIEGLEGGEQFALLNKIHHCMIDGAAGADLSQILLSPSPNAEIGETVPYLPRPAPTPLELLGSGLRHRASLPLRAVASARRGFDGAGWERVSETGRSARALADLSGWALRPASATPINGELGPHRRFDWLAMPLDDVRDLRRGLDCTVNDIVLATVTGALRRYLFRRRVDPRGLDFRVSAPVNVRRREHEGQLGNHVSSWILRLPLGEADPLEQLAAIGRSTAELKRSGASRALDLVMKAAEWLPAPVFAAAAELARGPVNTIVTNVPGPQFPLYLVGARLLGLYPMVPLIPGGGLGIALFSYEGKLCWGLNADYELVPDLRYLVSDLGAAFEELRGLAVERFMARRTGPAETPEPAVPRQQASSGPVEKPGSPRRVPRGRRPAARKKAGLSPEPRRPPSRSAGPRGPAGPPR